MSAVLAAAPAAQPIATDAATAKAAAPAIAVVLLGTGVVGGALLKLLNTPAAAS
jgi:aspartokinase/homoserine dehydrogenase 1